MGFSFERKETIFPISHTCLACLPSGRVRHCVPGFTEVESLCYSMKWV